MDLSEKIRDIPRQSGIYLLKDQKGDVIYIGKANNLFQRVSAYVQQKDTRYQIQFLMRHVVDVDTIITNSEQEALLLENTLIKKHRPRYNIQLKDDKSYVSIKLSVAHAFPQVFVTRMIRKDGALYFGPFSSAAAARETVSFIEKHFRLRTCSDHEFANRIRPCLQHQIQRCDAPCVGLIEEVKYQDTVDQVKLFLQGRKKDLLKILEKQMEAQSSDEEFEKAARTRDLVLSLKETLEKQNVARHSWVDQDVFGFHREGERLVFCVLLVREGKVCESLLFPLKGQGEDEEVLESFINQFYAADRFLPNEILIPGKIPSLNALADLFSEKKGQKVELLVPQRGTRKELIQLASRNAQEGLKRFSQKIEEDREILARLQEILGLQNFPQKIECFDISNTSGKEAVGSLVSFVEGRPNKSGYRRFKIKTRNEPDDFGMMREVLHRRLVRSQEKQDPKWVKPDLIVIDGGKGQLNVVKAIIEELNVTGIDLVSLAKEKEGEDQDKVYLPDRKNPVLLGRHSSVLHLLMRIRDEAHRFAITYHRKLRSKKFLNVP